MYRYTKPVSNLLSPYACSGCNSPDVAHKRPVRVDSFGFFWVFNRHQTVSFGAPLCEACNAVCDRREKNVYLIMKLIFLAVLIRSVYLFVTRPAFDAFWATVGWGILAVVACLLINFFDCPRVARFDGKCIRPLRKPVR